MSIYHGQGDYLKVRVACYFDEIWKHYFQPQKKIDYKMWLSKRAKCPVIAKQCQSTKKVLYAVFFKSEVPVVQKLCAEES